MYVLFCTFYQTLPSGPPWNVGAPAPSSSLDQRLWDPGQRNDSYTVSVLVSLMHLLQVSYRFCIRGARVTRITGRSRPPGGVGLTPRQYTVWNVEGRARSTGGLSLSRGCCLQCTVLLVLGGVLPNLELSHKRTKTTDHPTLCLGGIYSWWHSASPANGSGSHDSAPVSWAYNILCPTMVSPNASPKHKGGQAVVPGWSPYMATWTGFSALVASFYSIFVTFTHWFQGICVEYWPQVL